MAILETLYVLFKGDASQLRKESKDVDSLNKNTEKSFHDLNRASDNVGKSFLGVAKSLSSLIAGLVAAGGIIHGFKSSVDYAADLDKTSKALNVNVEALDAWSNAASLTGGSAQGFQTSLRSLANHLGTTGEVALKILPQLANTFQRLGNFRALRFGQMLGLDEATILLLQKGRREVDEVLKRQRELGVITKSQTEASRKLNYELDNTGHAFRSLYLGVGETVIPILTKFLNIIQDVAIYFQNHTDFIVGALIAMGGAAAIAAVSFGLLSLPVLAFVAAIGLFALAYDDLAVFFKGGDSLIGRAFDRWPKALQAIKIAFEDLKNVWKTITGEINPIEIRDNRTRLENVVKGQGLLNTASNSSFNSQSTNSVLNNRSFEGNKVNIAQVTINTQATDAQGVATALGHGIRDYLAQANSQFDDGISA